MPGTWNDAVASCAGASVRTIGTTDATGATGSGCAAAVSTRASASTGAGAVSRTGSADGADPTGDLASRVSPADPLWRRRSWATGGVWAFGSMSVRRRRGRGLGGGVWSSATRPPASVGSDGAESSTFRALSTPRIRC
jgi:hypothetical protein